jgi:hypothetical protein
MPTIVEERPICKFQLVILILRTSVYDVLHGTPQQQYADRAVALPGGDSLWVGRSQRFLLPPHGGGPRG